MITIKTFIEIHSNEDTFKPLIEELRLRDPSHIIALCEHTDGKSPSLVTYAPQECDLKRMRLDELCEKMKDGEVDLSEEEEAEADAILTFFDADRVWYAPSGFDIGKLDKS